MSEIVAKPSVQQATVLHSFQKAFAPVTVSDAYAHPANR
jgi:hypothetical protein